MTLRVSLCIGRYVWNGFVCAQERRAWSCHSSPIKQLLYVCKKKKNAGKRQIRQFVSDVLYFWEEQADKWSQKASDLGLNTVSCIKLLHQTFLFDVNGSFGRVWSHATAEALIPDVGPLRFLTRLMERSARPILNGFTPLLEARFTRLSQLEESGV